MLKQDETMADMPAFSRADWPEELQTAFEQGRNSGVVGSVLVSETERVRVWHLRLPVGQRCDFHRHVLDYFWTAHSPGRARNYLEDGSSFESDYQSGETKHFTFAKGEYFVHALENVGDSDLLFTSVEFLDSANEPLSVPDSVRLKSA